MGELASGSRNRSAPPRSGVLLVDKPAGVTSHDVVAQVRRTLPKKTKVGHAGTLDPFATGLLLILVGRATRAQRFLMALPKTYRAVARLGWTSTTGDPEGELSQTGRIPDDPQIPTGDLMQRPHAYSAVKVEGRRAYDIARAGEMLGQEMRVKLGDPGVAVAEDLGEQEQVRAGGEKVRRVRVAALVQCDRIETGPLPGLLRVGGVLAGHHRYDGHRVRVIGRVP